MFKTIIIIIIVLNIFTENKAKDIQLNFDSTKILVAMAPKEVAAWRVAFGEGDFSITSEMKCATILNSCCLGHLIQRGSMKTWRKKKKQQKLSQLSQL